MNSEAAQQPNNQDIPRRYFLETVVTVFGALWTLLALYPVYRYLRPAPGAAQQTTVTRVVVGRAADLPVGQGQNFQFGNIPGIITHTPDGQFHAFNAICTHLGCTVQFRADINRIWCACHGGVYDPATGRNIAGPPPRPLEPLNVVVQEGQLVVTRA